MAHVMMVTVMMIMITLLMVLIQKIIMSLYVLMMMVIPVMIVHQVSIIFVMMVQIMMDCRVWVLVVYQSQLEQLMTKIRLIGKTIPLQVILAEGLEEIMVIIILLTNLNRKLVPQGPILFRRKGV